MLYNAVIQKENVGLNINDIERLKDFAKAMGHSVLADGSRVAKWKFWNEVRKGA